VVIFGLKFWTVNEYALTPGDATPVKTKAGYLPIKPSTTIAPRLKPGDILFFDEFGVPTHEFRAFMDVAWAYRMKYKLLGAVNNYMQIALKIL